MLTIVKNRNNIKPYQYKFDTADVFYSGQIMHFDDQDANLARRCYINPPHFSKQHFNSNSDLCGIVEDTYDLSIGISTCTQGLVSVWPFASGLIIETDMFDSKVTYYPGDPLYVSWNGLFSNLNSCPYPGVIPIIADVVGPPNNLNSNMLINLYPLPKKITYANIVTSAITGNTILFSSAPTSLFFKFAIPEDTESTKEIFNGIKMPNGHCGSQCKKCGGYNEYIMDKNYICYNCK